MSICYISYINVKFHLNSVVLDRKGNRPLQTFIFIILVIFIFIYCRYKTEKGYEDGETAPRKNPQNTQNDILV